MGYGYVIVPGTAGGGTKTLMMLPSQKGTLTYDGTEKSGDLQWNNFDSDQLTLTIIGDTHIDAGKYRAKFTPTNGCRWSDGTTTAREVQWEISRAPLTWSNKTHPKQTGTVPTYTGETISCTWANFSYTDYVTLYGETGKNAGLYNAYFTPDNNHCWSDTKTYETRSVEWKINPIKITKPTAKTTTFTFNNQIHSIVLNNFNNSNMNIIDNSFVEVGTYNAIVNLNDHENYVWSDDSSEGLSFTWTINKANEKTPVISGMEKGDAPIKSTSKLYLSSEITSVELKVEANFNLGDIEVDSEYAGFDSSMVSYVIDNYYRTITVTALASGITTIRLRIGETDNTNASAWVTLAVRTNMPDDMMTKASVNSYAEINNIIKNGAAQNYFAIGDYFEVNLNGDWVDVSFDNEKVYATIIGFNHNSGIEGQNTVHFCLGYKKIEDEESGKVYFKNTAFCGAVYETDTNGTPGSSVHSTTISLYGTVAIADKYWKNSRMRTTILNGITDDGSESGATDSTNTTCLLKVLPSDLVSCIISAPKYSTNAVSGTSNLQAAVTRTKDKLWILDHYEVNTKEITSTNATYLKNVKLQQYEFFKNYWAKIRYSFADPNKRIRTYFRTKVTSSSNNYIAMTSDGSNGFSVLWIRRLAACLPCFGMGTQPS